jgi:hypothetical protein
MKRITCLTVLVLLLATIGFGQQSINLTAPPPSYARIVTASNSGIPGNTVYYYWVNTRYPVGSVISPLASPGVVRNGAATISGASPNQVGWTANAGATGYDVIRLTTRNFTGSCTGCVVSANQASNNFTDIGGGTTNWPPTPAVTLAGTAKATLQLNNRDFAVPTVFVSGIPAIGLSVGASPTSYGGPLSAAPGGTVSAFKNYVLTAIANTVNGCTNATGCWQINGVLGANKTNGLTQDVVLFQLPAKGYVTDTRITGVAACTGTTTALSGLGTATNTVYYQAQTYNIAPGPGDTNFSDVTAARGSTNKAAVNVVASLITTGTNVNTLVAGCSISYEISYSVLP